MFDFKIGSIVHPIYNILRVTKNFILELLLISKIDLS